MSNLFDAFDFIIDSGSKYKYVTLPYGILKVFQKVFFLGIWD